MADNDEPKINTRGSETSGEKKASGSKGKAPVKRTHESTKTKDSSESVKNDLNSNLILECLKNIQQSQTSLVKRIEAIEHSNYYEYDEEGDYEYECDQPGPSCSKRTKTSESEDIHITQTISETPSRFSSLSKKFKPTDICSEDIDSVLSDNVSDLFRKGMDEELYDKTVKDENCPRPANCEGLLVARMNKLVWDVMSQQSRSLDRKMQMISTSVVKAGVFLSKTMDKAAQLEMKLTEIEKEGEFNMAEVIEGCHSAIALMGHANYQVNMTRRDLLRPELKREYSHLCTHSLPVTKELFGDDVSKTAREIEDFAKIGNRLSHSSQPSYRGGFRGRSGFRTRIRGSRGRGYYGSQNASTPRYGMESKNFSRRGGSRSQQK